MAYGIETLQTTRGTRIDIEEHKAPTGVAGIVAHWGERIPDPELKDKISEIFPGIELDKNTGFDLIYHQKDGTTRAAGIEDELEVARLVGLRTLKANGWKPEEVSSLYVGSGVPIADNDRYQNYGKVIKDMIGLKPDTDTHTSYTACASGGHELVSALTNPKNHGKKTLIIGMEGITYLTEDFNPEYADHLSMRFFSNGAAGIGVIPGENMTLLHSAHSVVADEKRTLTAKMTYGHLVDKDGPTWQDIDEMSFIKLPVPEGKLRLTMQGPRTGQFFASNGVELLSHLKKEHEEKFPEFEASYGVAHHPSLGVNEHLLKRLAREGFELEIPWVVNDGNSSAATSLIAELRLLDRAKDGSVQLFTTYGAGGSFDGAYILNAEKPHNLVVGST